MYEAALKRMSAGYYLELIEESMQTILLREGMRGITLNSSIRRFETTIILMSKKKMGKKKLRVEY